MLLKYIFVFVRVIIVDFFDCVLDYSLIVYNGFWCYFVVCKNYVCFGYSFYVKEIKLRLEN